MTAQHLENPFQKVPASEIFHPLRFIAPTFTAIDRFPRYYHRLTSSVVQPSIMDGVEFVLSKSNFLKVCFSVFLLVVTTIVIAEEINISQRLESKIYPDTIYHLDRLWPTYDQDPGIVAYKQNYFLLTYTNTPNNTPTSPNPKNTPVSSNDYKPVEAKFQFSLKTQVPHLAAIGDANSIWFGYTQQSNWQITDTLNSRPFRENNYEPELIFSHRFANSDKPSNRQISPRFVNIGMVHQSNGQSLPRSRSWNRYYIQFGLEREFDDNNSVALTVRPWVRRDESLASDDNPDITQHLGRGDLELLYWHGDRLLSALARSRSLQLDYSMPSPFGRNTSKSLHCHLQAFTGYGESLIDYNQYHSTVGFGFSLPYDISPTGK